MSTRAIIARWTPATTVTWEGRYHHYDGYPTGLGRQLHQLHHGHFNGDTDAMKRVLIEEHTGWSTINGADWTKPIRAYNSQDYVCEECGAHNTAHYRQYYYDTPKLLPPPAMADAANPVLVLGHQPVDPHVVPGPVCYCHDENGRKIASATDDWITSDGDDGGTEWAYVIDSLGITVFERNWNTGGHMTGMFGMGGGDQARWLHRGHVAWQTDDAVFDQFEQVIA